ncbi:MAG: hypothetical protein MUE85_19170 [Microscillaceae bacterium]|jgi:hypothetical protein|nr:hypothetical protein [Microscillaceae bacterium]
MIKRLILVYLLSSFTISTNAQIDSARFVIDSYIKQVGIWDSINILQQEFVVNEKQSANKRIWTNTLRIKPFGFHLKITSANSTQVSLLNDTYEFHNIDGKVKKMPSSYRDNVEYPYEFNYPNPLGLLFMQARKIDFDYNGKKEIDKKLYYEVITHLTDDIEQTFYFDIKTFLLKKEIKKSKNGRLNNEIDYMNYKQFHNIQIPSEIKEYIYGGGFMIFTLKKVTINPLLKASFFDSL